MSTKGMSVIAARVLADKMCACYDIPLLTDARLRQGRVLIAGTLQRDTRRYEFQNSFERIVLGLCLEDVKAMELKPNTSTIRRAASPR